MLDLSAIGARIRSCREAQGLTREQFSEAINVTPRFLYDIELGNKGMSIDTLANIGNKLHVSTDYILVGTTPDTQNDINPELIALITQCPISQREHLSEITKHFIAALHEHGN